MSNMVMTGVHEHCAVRTSQGSSTRRQLASIPGEAVASPKTVREARALKRLVLQQAGRRWAVQFAVGVQPSIH